MAWEKEGSVKVDVCGRLGEKRGNGQERRREGLGVRRWGGTRGEEGRG